VLWVHAISVGEVLAVEHFINYYKKEHPDHRCYLTTGTLGGMQVAKKLTADQVSYIPFDFLVTTYLAFKRIHPVALVLVEAEIWPNLLMLAHFKKIPLYLLNGRINPQSAHLRRYLGFLYALFTHIFAQSTQDAQALAAMSAIPQRISVLGDIKTFNVIEKKQALLAAQPAPFMPPRHPYVIVLAGSLHAGEVDTYLTTLLQLRHQLPTLRFIMVPRHFYWQQELIGKLTASQVTFTLWTETTQLPPTLAELGSMIIDTFATNQVLVVCKLGVLFCMYPFATVYCLGGTFVPVGGHNLLEPAVWANPCLIGPNHHKCSAIAEALHAAGGLIKATTPQELQSHLYHLATKQQQRAAMGKANEAWITFQAEIIKQKLINFIKNLQKRDFIPFQ
jgi:3-deoxy-D-manno-octulosonic-acid transferase